MERELLERLLGGDDEASLAARAALRAGASLVVWDGTVSAGSLARVYGRLPGTPSRRASRRPAWSEQCNTSTDTADRFEWARSGLPMGPGPSCCFWIRTAARWWHVPAFDGPRPSSDIPTTRRLPSPALPTRFPGVSVGSWAVHLRSWAAGHLCRIRSGSRLNDRERS